MRISDWSSDVCSSDLFAGVISQILVLDIVFSLDSVITAVGLADEVGVMIAAVIIAVCIMMFSSGPISRFVERHPTVNMLALSFLVLIGVSLIAEGLEQHIPKGYISFRSHEHTSDLQSQINNSYADLLMQK